MTTTPHIRAARPSDLDELLDLWQALMANGSAADPRFAASGSARQHLRGWASGHWFTAHPVPAVHVAVLEELEGFVHLHVPEPHPLLAGPVVARFADLYVRPRTRGRGCARRLVDHVESAARRAGIQHFEVGTLTADATAVGFWRAMGFGPWKVELRKD